MHLLMLLFPTVILTLEREWAAPYSQLIALVGCHLEARPDARLDRAFMRDSAC